MCLGSSDPFVSRQARSTACRPSVCPFLSQMMEVTSHLSGESGESSARVRWSGPLRPSREDPLLLHPPPFPFLFHTASSLFPPRLPPIEKLDKVRVEPGTEFVINECACLEKRHTLGIALD